MPDPGAAEASARHQSRHLRRRVREEARAAVNAAGLRATLAHLALATAYARRLLDQKQTAPASAANPVA
ncbi:MAG TPA: hypothetical protein VF688_10170 [Allosphingosinicella sp.]